MRKCIFMITGLILIFLPFHSVKLQYLSKEGMIFIKGIEKTVNFTDKDKKRIFDICLQIGNSENYCHQEFQFIFEINQFYFKVDSFYIDKYPVSIKSFMDYLDKVGKPYPKSIKNYAFKDKEINKRLSEYPAFGMNWYDADGYCKSLGKRLPSSDEYLAVMYKGEFFPFDHYKEYNTRVRNQKYGFLLEPIGNNPYDVGNGGVIDVYGNLLEWTSTNYCQSFNHKRRVNVNFKDSIPMTQSGDTVLLFGTVFRRHVFGKDSCSSEDVILKGASYGTGVSGLFLFYEGILGMDSEYGGWGFRCAKDYEPALDMQPSPHSVPK